MRAYISVGFNIESEDELPIIQSAVENALHNIDCWVCDADISPEDGEDGDEDDFLEDY